MREGGLGKKKKGLPPVQAKVPKKKGEKERKPGAEGLRAPFTRAGKTRKKKKKGPVAGVAHGQAARGTGIATNVFYTQMASLERRETQKTGACCDRMGGTENQKSLPRQGKRDLLPQRVLSKKDGPLISQRTRKGPG